MIVDTSALMAILQNESDAETFIDAITEAASVAMSAATFVELSIVIDSRGDLHAAQQMDMFIRRTPIEIVPVTVEQANIARIAYLNFGKGNHPARLNFGDCFAYALAKERSEPLLFKGQDFALTDIEAAL